MKEPRFGLLKVLQKKESSYDKGFFLKANFQGSSLDSIPFFTILFVLNSLPISNSDQFFPQFFNNSGKRMEKVSLVEKNDVGPLDSLNAITF